LTGMSAACAAPADSRPIIVPSNNFLMKTPRVCVCLEKTQSTVGVKYSSLRLFIVSFSPQQAQNRHLSTKKVQWYQMVRWHSDTSKETHPDTTKRRLLDTFCHARLFFSVTYACPMQERADWCQPLRARPCWMRISSKPRDMRGATDRTEMQLHCHLRGNFGLLIRKLGRHRGRSRGRPRVKLTAIPLTRARRNRDQYRGRTGALHQAT
jgi:hypothetical protein